MQEPGSPHEAPGQSQQSSFEPPPYSAPLTEFSPPGVPIPSPLGDMPNSWNANTLATNDSGTGATAVLPQELQGFSWAACLMTWIWSIGMQFWLGLLILPASWILQAIFKMAHVEFLTFIVNIAAMIGFGVKGNEWAWQSRKWESIEQFRATQRVWTIWGVVIIGLVVLMMIFAVVVAGAFLATAMRGGGR